MKKTKLCLCGGGHGLSRILYGLKEFKYLSAIVTVADRGGSTGKLRAKFDCPAMGDIRLCLDSLGDKYLKGIFETRTKGYEDCIGNLIIASLIKLYNFEEAIAIMHKMLGLSETHKIIPVSLDNYEICGKYINNKEIRKETEFILEEKIENTWLSPKPIPNPEALKAINESDFVIISSGSFFTSILSNLLVPQIAEAINKKTIIWIVNLMQEKGETIGMDADAHAEFILKYINHIDYALVNTSKPSDDILKQHYESYLMPLTYISDDKVKHIVYGDYMKYTNSEVIHNSYKITKALKSIIK
jgi:uncharacterized cofD-like protein